LIPIKSGDFARPVTSSGYDACSPEEEAARFW